MGKDSGGGGGKALLLLLLVAACAAGGWNYHRNLQTEIEEQGPRRFEAYSDGQLADLAAAYQTEIDGYMEYVQASRARTTRVRDEGLLGDRVREFARVQAVSEKERAYLGALAERQNRLADPLHLG